MALKIRLKRPKEKTSVLMTEFSRNGIPFKFYTGKTIQCKNWSESKQEVLSKEENYDLINSYLDKWKTELKRIIAEMETNRERLNKDIIQARLDNYFRKGNTKENSEDGITDFISFIENYCLKMKSSQKDPYRLPQTKVQLILAFNLLTKKSLAEYRSGSKDYSSINLKADYKLPFEDINLKFMEKFKDYLTKATYSEKIKGNTVVKQYANNYAVKHLKILKQFIIQAIEDKYVEPFTWNTFKAEINEVDSVYTDLNEIQQIFDVHLDNELEKTVRDKYVLNCFLGMRYSDLNKLEPHCFSKRTISRKEYLVYTGRTKKTDHRVEFALHSTAQDILEKYSYQIPKLDLQTFNTVLRQVAVKARLTGLERVRELRGGKITVLDIPKYELMSSHTGRRSFCTNFYNEGVAIAAIMSISGHQTEKEFRKYIKKASVRLEIVAEQISAIKGINFTGVADHAA
jgi:site-specific recombinase XerD